MQPSTKHPAPWRLGTTSYILPDDVIPNVRYLAPMVDDIELVLFESEGYTNLPTASVVRDLSALQRDHNLTYTVHFPLDVYPGSSEAAVRSHSVDVYRHIRDLCSPFTVFSYVFHFTPETYSPVPASDVGAWLEALETTVGELLADGFDPQMLSVETLSYPFGIVLPIVLRNRLSVTLDIGHVWLAGYDANQLAQDLLGLARVIHLHGVSQGHDHLGLECTERLLRDSFLDALHNTCIADGKQRVLTLEVFGQEAFESSMAVVDSWMHNR